MANLSNTGIVTGAMQGIDRGINSAGAIYGLMQKKEEMDRERNLSGVKERILRQSADTGELALSEQQAQAKYLESPFNYKGTQQYLNMTPEEKANADGVWSALPATRRGLQQYMDIVKTNESLAKDLTAAHTRPLGMELVKTGNAYNALIAPGSNATPEQIAAGKVNYERAKNAFDAAQGATDKIVKGVALNEVMKNNPDLAKTPAMQMILPIAQQTGDISGLLDVVKELARHEGKVPGASTAVGAFIQGEINKGRTDLSAIGREAANLKSDVLSHTAEEQRIRIGIATQEGKAQGAAERTALDKQAQILRAIANLERTGVIDALVAGITNKPVNSSNPGDVANAKQALLIRLKDIQQYIPNPADRVNIDSPSNVPATMQGLDTLMPGAGTPYGESASGLLRSMPQSGKRDQYGYIVGETMPRNGNNYRYIGNDQWQRY
jgi:hypothetical protein